MSHLLHHAVVAALLVGLLTADAPNAKAAPYDDYGFYLLDTPAAESTRQRSSSRTSFRTYSRRSTSPRVVSNCPPAAIATVVPGNPTSPTVTQSRPITTTMAPSQTRATVARDRANVMLGQDIVGQIPVGSVVDVVEIRGTWVGVQVENEAEDSKGWIRRDDLQLISTQN